MKKSIFFMAAFICVIAACNGLNGVQTDDPLAPVEGDQVESVTFEVPVIKAGDDPATKSVIVPNGNNISFTWEATDTVGIYPDSGAQVFFSMVDGAGTNEATFTGGGWALRENSTYSSYYPFVGDMYVARSNVPVSFSGQKQSGHTTFAGAKLYLASSGTSSQNGSLHFTFGMMNTIILVSATLPAGTYTKATLTVNEPLFVKNGHFSLDQRVIVGDEYSKKLEIKLENFTLSSSSTVPIYMTSAPVDLTGKEVTVRIYASNGTVYKCVKTPSKAYNAGTWYGLSCAMTESTNDFTDIAVPEIVDLGLSVKWASFNLGATCPEEYGYYYQWGETEPETESYDWAHYQHCMGAQKTLTKYCFYKGEHWGYNNFVDNIFFLEEEDDAACVQLGGNWRMPTYNEMCELRDNCTLAFCSMNGVDGIRFYSNISGYWDKWIFIPLSGYRNANNVYQVGGHAHLWTSSLYMGDPSNVTNGSTPNTACDGYLSVSSTNKPSISPSYCFRYEGCSIRPVYVDN